MSAYTDLARQSLEHFLRYGSYLDTPPDLPENFLSERRGTFVSWHDKDDNLRGCIGTFMPTQKSIAEEIIINAVSAGIEDPRFPQISMEELTTLNCKVDILSELERVQNYERDLNPRKYGVFIKTPDGRSGLLLPDLDGVNTVYQQVSIACEKGGINPQEDDIAIYRFTVNRFGE